VVQDDDKGEVTLHVGPTMVSPTAADRVVIDDGQGGFREDPSARPQMMVEVGDNQYSVLYNPLVENEAGPNGKFKQGRNEPRPLKNGTRSMIPGPCSFWLRPGQCIEVRDAHELALDQYLAVKVYAEVDKTAPFYEVTAKSAAITRATAENVRDDKTTGATTRIDQLLPLELRRGQLIVIRGLDTQLYIPPTGVDIVPDTSVDDTGAGMTAAAACQPLSQLPKLDEAHTTELFSSAAAAAGEELDDDQGYEEEVSKQAPQRNFAQQAVQGSISPRGRVGARPRQGRRQPRRPPRRRPPTWRRRARRRSSPRCCRTRRCVACSSGRPSRRG
jgi:hypothetical protein